MREPSEATEISILPYASREVFLDRVVTYKAPITARAMELVFTVEKPLRLHPMAGVSLCLRVDATDFRQLIYRWRLRAWCYSRKARGINKWSWF